MRFRANAPPMVSGPLVRSRRVLALLTAVVVGVVVVGLAVTLTNSASAGRVAENASLLHWTNAAQGSAALARSAVGQAVVFAAGHELGVADDQAFAAAVAEARGSIEAFEEWADVVPAGLSDWRPELGELLEVFGAAGNDVLRLVVAGQGETAAGVRDEAFEAAYGDIAMTIEASQREITDRISSNEDRAALIAQMTRVLVTLLIPAAALIVYWRIARRQLRERRLEMSAKIIAQREMIAGVSHELRTPLTAIYGFSEILLDGDGGDPDATAELIRVINTEAADLTRMVEDLLTAARIDMNELTFVATEFTPRDEIATIAAPFERAGHVIGVDCETGTITADDLRFRQILRNLISNAVRHGGPHTMVTGMWDTEGAQFAVMDDGPGVDDALQARLFQPFVNHGEQALLSGSVGLGLAVSLAAARGMGGDLKHDRSDGWTTFTLTLPPDSTDRTQDTVSARSLTGAQSAVSGVRP